VLLLSQIFPALEATLTVSTLGDEPEAIIESCRIATRNKDCQTSYSADNFTGLGSCRDRTNAISLLSARKKKPYSLPRSLQAKGACELSA
jgi:hypothetical protein